MASLNQHLQIRTPKETFNFRQTEPYNEVFTIRKDSNILRMNF